MAPTRHQQLQDVVRSVGFSVLIDFVVVVNVLSVGLEVDLHEDAPFLFLVLRHTVVGIYVIEMGVRIAADGKEFFLWRPMNFFELVLVLLAIVDVWILQRVTWLWRASIARSVRLLRIWRVAESFPALHDLWLVLTGLARASRSLVWLAMLVGLMVFACGGAIRGLMGAEGMDESGGACEGGPGIDCIDMEEYFGSVGRSALTLLQLTTLDNWASHVVRPLLLVSPFQATVLVLFVLASAYMLLSVAVGVLVWSTVSLARSHQAHADHQHQLDVQDKIRLMTNYLRGTLAIEDRSTLDLKELTDAMSVPQFAHAFKALELPVDTVGELFQHLDPAGVGEISLEIFELGLKKMKSPSTRFDVAILTATVGGSATYVRSMEGRTSDVLEDLQRTRRNLKNTFEQLRELALHEAQQVPEVMLRAQGRIRPVAEDEKPIQKPRFTG